MPRNSTARPAAAAVGAVLVLVCAIALAGCGDDRPTKVVFVQHMTSISSTPDARSPQWQAIWGCTYDKITDDDAIGQMMALQPGQSPSRDLSTQVSKVIVQCMPAQPTTTTTSSPP
jgi:hypothetical protein